MMAGPGCAEVTPRGPGPRLMTRTSPPTAKASAAGAAPVAARSVFRAVVVAT